MALQVLAVTGDQAIVQTGMHGEGERAVGLARILERQEGRISREVSVPHAFNYTQFHHWKKPTSEESHEIATQVQKLLDKEGGKKKVVILKRNKP